MSNNRPSLGEIEAALKPSDLARDFARDFDAGALAKRSSLNWT